MTSVRSDRPQYAFTQAATSNVMRIRGENISESAVLKDIAGTALDNGVGAGQTD
jgi:hypothetical protein